MIVDHQDALGAGFAVTEVASDGKAAQEIYDLWRWVWKQLTAEPIDRGQAPIRAAGYATKDISGPALRYIGLLQTDDA
ncbi:MAG: hypothetical protein ABSD08_20835 [Xanthobacteraceae bacterium]|jgi:hypothetical protein